MVALLDDISILDDLSAAPGEVAHIFDHPLEALLDPGLARSEKLVSVGSEDWPYEVELHVSRHFRPDILVRYHCFFLPAGS